MKRQNSPNITMRVRVGESELEITGPADFVEKKIAEFVKRPPPAITPPASPPIAAIHQRSSKPLSPAQFFKSCSPRTDTARALVAAYFLEKQRNAENSTSSEIRDLIRQAKVPPPTNVSESINQNIRKGYLMTAGDRGNKMAFVLTSDGESAVEEMQHTKPQ
jgi:hypothetical protein